MITLVVATVLAAAAAVALGYAISWWWLRPEPTQTALTHLSETPVSPLLPTPAAARPGSAGPASAATQVIPPTGQGAAAAGRAGTARTTRTEALRQYRHYLVLLAAGGSLGAGAALQLPAASPRRQVLA